MKKKRNRPQKKPRLELPDLYPWEQVKAFCLLHEALRILHHENDGKPHKVEIVLSKSKFREWGTGGKRRIAIFVDGVRRVGRWLNEGNQKAVGTLFFNSHD